MDLSLFVAFGMLGFSFLVALTIIVLALRLQFQKQEQAHRERMKALEQGVLAEVLRAQGDMTRARAAGAVGVLVPVVLAAAAAAGTGLVLSWADAIWRVTVLCVIWGVCGVVSLVTVTTSLDVLRRGSRGRPRATPSADSEAPPAVSLTAIKGATPPLRPE
jgi:hypothetical protein